MTPCWPCVAVYPGAVQRTSLSTPSSRLSVTGHCPSALCLLIQGAVALAWRLSNQISEYSRSKLDKCGALLVTADWKSLSPGHARPRPPSCWQPCQRSRTQAALHQRCQIPDSVNGPERIAARGAACLFPKEGTKPTWAPRLSSCWNARRAVAFAQKGFEKGTDRTHFLFMRCSH